MMNAKNGWTLLAFGLSAASVAWPQVALAAGDAQAGATKAAMCAACHGQNGISVNPLWPSLAGQQETYLAKQITAFRDEARTDISMQPFVTNLTDQDIADLAAYYTSLPPCP